MRLDPETFGITYNQFVGLAPMPKGGIQIPDPPEPRRALLETVRYHLVEAPWRNAQYSRLSKAVQSHFLETQAKIAEAEAQGSVVNTSLALYNNYAQANGIVEPTRITHDSLRWLCESCPPLAAIVGKRVEQVSSFARRRHSHVGRSAEPGFRVRLANSRERATTEDKEQTDVLEQMIEEGGFCPPPDEEKPFGWQPGFDYFLRTGTRDLLTLDWVAVRMWPSAKDPKKYPVVSFAPIDAARVRRLMREYVDVVDGVVVTKPQPSERENTKKEIVTVRVDDGGGILDEFTADEVFVGCRRPRTAQSIFGYGFSEAEEAIDAATAWCNGLRHNATRFTSDSLPRGILTLLGNPTSQQAITAFQMEWRQMLEGANKRWRVPVFQAKPDSGAKVQWDPIDLSPRDMEYSQFMFILALICHAAYSMHPDETGYSAASPFRPPLSEASPETKLKYSQDTGLRPILWWWENFINRHIVWRMFPSRRYKFEFTGLGDWDETADAAMRTARMQAGLTTPEMEWNDLDIVMPDEIREHPASRMPGLWSANYQLLQAAQQADQQAAQGQEAHSANLAQVQAKTDSMKADAAQKQFGSKGADSGAESGQNRALASQTRQMSPNPADNIGKQANKLNLRHIE